MPQTQFLTSGLSFLMALKMVFTICTNTQPLKTHLVVFRSLTSFSNSHKLHCNYTVLKMTHTKLPVTYNMLQITHNCTGKNYNMWL